MFWSNGRPNTVVLNMFWLWKYTKAYGTLKFTCQPRTDRMQIFKIKKCRLLKGY